MASIATIAPHEQDHIEKAINDSLTLVRAFKMIIKAPEGGLEEFVNKPMESFADIEKIIQQKHLDRFWETWSPYESKVKQEQGRKGYFASYIRESTLDYDLEFFQKHLKTIETALEEVRELSHSYFETGDEEKKLEIKNKLQQMGRALTCIWKEFGAFARHIPEKADEIPKYELVFDEIMGKSPEESIKDKDRRIDRRKDVLQILVAEISEDLQDIKHVLGIESVVASIGTELQMQKASNPGLGR